MDVLSIPEKLNNLGHIGWVIRNSFSFFPHMCQGLLVNVDCCEVVIDPSLLLFSADSMRLLITGIRQEEEL